MEYLYGDWRFLSSKHANLYQDCTNYIKLNLTLPESTQNEILKIKQEERLSLSK